MESLDVPLICPPPESRCSRFFKRLFCCNRKGSNPWKRWYFWDKIREKLSKKVQLDKTYSLLIDVYSHRLQDINFSLCKIEKDPASKSRDDLEFYIPQLCNFMIYGEKSEAEQIKEEILKLSQQSFFFSHRVIWFISSLVDQRSTTLNPTQIIEEIKNASKGNYQYCLSNSDGITQRINYREEEMRVSTLEAIQNYKEGSSEGCIYTEWIPLGPFGSIEQDPYFSTLVFFDKLYEISLKLYKMKNNIDYLKAALEGINDYLPAGVYIPFVSSNLRDYCLLHIRTSETVVFATKGKAPFRLTFELFCPGEEFKTYSKEEQKFDKRKDSTCSVQAIEMLSNEFLAAQEFLKEANWHAEEENTQKSYSVLSDKISCVYGAELDEKSVYIYENFDEQEARVRNSSTYGSLLSWKMVNIIVKTGDDLRQEQLAIQILTYFKEIFLNKKLKLWLYPYEIIATHQYSGIIECVSNAVSIDYLKKKLPEDRKSLKDYFLLNFGETRSSKYKKAQEEFMRSLAGYSLACFILKLKDRHNGNILIDTAGHIIHIDFGFMLSNSPGGNMNFESAPFKLTEEFEHVLGGRHSRIFNRFRNHCVEGFMALCKNAEQIILMVEMMRNGSGASLPCFVGGEAAVEELRNRLLPFTDMTRARCKKYINELIDTSLDHWTTRWYDKVQYFFQGTLY